MVVDDSMVMRQMISDYLAKAPDIEVVGTASDGRKAIAACLALSPDVITLDIQMPGMDGLQTLDELLAKKPTPVVMVSSLTHAGATITMDALDRGAVDYVAKPDRGAAAERVLGDELVRKVRLAAGSNVRRILEIRKRRRTRPTTLAARSTAPTAGAPAKAAPAGEAERLLADKCIALGISTGGPPALGVLFEALKPPMPPILVVQHMPAQFTKPLAWRLDSRSQLTIREGAEGDVLKPNHVYIAPGAYHMLVRGRPGSARVRLSNSEPVSGHKPSADVLMKSAAAVFGRNTLGVIMTGMGRDGADGCGAIRSAGGYVLGQDEASSDVYGMNKVAFVEGHVDKQFGLYDGARVITHFVHTRWLPSLAAAR
ncbi:MAG: chemotaxis response regulator protein-glutamate methylesterase [Planctomycetota bacterium]|nr:MAG: chemotaxis response regulator protein-glutamate methylesterase [Planctomycetota bacterium]